MSEHAVVSGTLSAVIEDHAVASGGCRSYLTRGLERFEQREIAFAVPAVEGDAPAGSDQIVLEYFRFCHTMASQGRTVSAGALTVFADPNPFRVPGCGIAYVEPPEGIWPPIPGHALLALYLRPEEAAATRSASAYRAAAWLGFASRIFPYPAVSDLGRPTTMPEGLPASVLSKVRVLVDWKASQVFLRDRTLHLRLGAGTRENLAIGFAKFENNPIVAIVTGHVRGADARLVWLPKRDAPPVIAPLGSRAALLEGVFAVLIGAQQADEAWIMEDGFSVRLRPESWAAARAALESRTVVEIPMGGTEDRFVRRLRIEYA